MIAGGQWIRRALRSGLWPMWIEGHPTLTPDDAWLDKHVRSNSVDVTLGRHLLIPETSNLPVRLRAQPGAPLPDQVANEQTHPMWERHDMIAPGRNDGYVLQPGGFILGSCREAFDCSRDAIYLAQMYDGRSTCGRLGIQSHMTAGFGDYGFSGAFTLEIHNCFPRPIELFYGMRIGQVSFHQVEEPIVYAGAYTMAAHRDGPVAPKLGEGRF